MDWHEPIYLPSVTQKRRIEAVYYSDEAAIRARQYPTINERIQQQKDWVAQQIEEARIAAQREALKKEHAKLVAKAQSREAQDETEIAEAEDIQQLLDEMKRLG